MRAAGISADAYTYEALAAACGLAGEWDAAEAILREMTAGCNDHEGNEAVVSNDGGSGGDGGGVRVKGAAAEVAVAMAGSATVTADLGDGATTWNGDRAAPAPSPVTTADSSSAAAAGRESWNQRLRHELRQRRRQEQLKNGVPPSPRVLHGLMEAYARAGEWERALECLDDMLHGSKGSLEEGQPVGTGKERERVGVRAGVKPDSTSVGWAMQVR